MSSHTEETVLTAIDSYQNNEYTSICSCSYALKIPKSTLINRLSKADSRTIARIKQQILTTSKESALVKWIGRLSKTRHPITLALTSFIIARLTLGRD
jgi:hypothetical protein